MLSEVAGFVGRMKKKVRDAGLPPIVTVHCLLHQEQLCAKVFHKFKPMMDTVMKIVNFCAKQGLNHREFKGFLDDLESAHKDIPFYCAARWLSCSKVLSVFFDLRREIALFTDMKGSPQLDLDDEQWVADLAFMKDITGYLSDLNVSLQGKNKLISTMSDRIESFKSQILLFKGQLENGIFDNFPSLKSLNVRSFQNVSEYTEALVIAQ